MLETGRNRRQREKHPLWALILSFFLASLYWVYLDKTVTRMSSIACTITKDISPHTDLSTLMTNTINLRVPTDYTISRILDNNTGKPFHGKIILSFRGPGGVLKRLDQGPILFVDVKEPKSNEYDFIFDKNSVKSITVELPSYLVSMEPSELKLELVKTSSLEIPLQSERLAVVYPEDPEGDWQKRIFLDTLRFSHATVTLKGSRNLLAGIRAETKVFELDCRNLPERMPALLRAAKGNERPQASFPIRLRSEFGDLKIVEGEIQATLEVAPPARIFPSTPDSLWTLPVHPEWRYSKLDPSRFRVDETIQIRIKSYNPELTRELESKGQDWAKHRIYCYVELERVRPPVEGQDFYEQLEPAFLCKDTRFLPGRDFEIIVKSIVAVVRRDS